MKKKISIILALACLAPLMSFAEESSAEKALAEAKKDVEKVELKVSQDFDKALAEAKKEGKILMLHFSGSDWCPPCKMLHKFVTDTKDFAEYANKNLKYVFSDWDRASGPKSKEFAARHEKLAQEFQLEGFPTIVLINPQNNKAYKIVGFEVRTPKELIERIEVFKEKSK